MINSARYQIYHNGWHFNLCTIFESLIMSLFHRNIKKWVLSEVSLLDLSSKHIIISSQSEHGWIIFKIKLSIRGNC